MQPGQNMSIKADHFLLIFLFLKQNKDTELKRGEWKGFECFYSKDNTNTMNI